MDEKGNFHPVWVDYKTLEGVPFDVAIVGYGGETVNFLRLWESKASQEFDLNIFNEGGYVEAVREKTIGETISKVLYPNDATENGKELRLIQQYFFVSCSLQDIIRRFKAAHSDWEDFPEFNVIQLNDTHPASPFRSSCACSSMKKVWSGETRGRSCVRLSITPTTHYFQKH